MTGEATLAGVGRRALGERFGYFVVAFAAAYAAGSCVSYVVLIADFLPDVITGAGVDPSSFLASRAFTIAVVTVCVLLPLSLAKSLSALQSSSLLAVGGILSACAVICWRGIFHGDSANLAGNAPSIGLFAAAPVFNVSFIMHYNAPRFFHELRTRTLPHMARIVAAAFGAAFALYTAVALCGVRAFGPALHGDALNNFARSGRSAEAVLVLVARAVLACVICCTYPLAMHALRASLASLVLDGDPGNHPAFRPATLVLVLVTAVVGWAVKDVSVVLSYKGAVAGSTLVYAIPAAIYAALLLNGLPPSPLSPEADDSGAVVVPAGSAATPRTADDPLLPKPAPKHSVLHVRAGCTAATLFGLAMLVLGVLTASGLLKAPE